MVRDVPLALGGVLRRVQPNVIDVVTPRVGTSLEGPSHKEGMKLRNRLIVCYETVRVHSAAGARAFW